MKNKIKLGRKEPLVKNLLLIEGISRAGKFLLANLLHGFRGIEPVQYYGLFRAYPVFGENKPNRQNNCPTNICNARLTAIVMKCL